MKTEALTAKQVQFMKPADKRIEVPAGPPAGLYLVIHPTGKKSWALRYRWNGRPIKLTLGEGYPEMSLAAARGESLAKLADLERGVDPLTVKAEEQQQQKQPDSVKSVAEEWMTRHVKNTRTWPEVERVLNREVLHEWKHRLITEIGRKDVLRLLDAIVDRGAPIQANRTLSILKRLFNWCLERGIVEASPVAGIKRPATEKSRERVLEDDELASVWNAAESLGYPFGPFVRFLLLSSQRRREVAGMRWDDVNLDRAIWTLPAWATKPGRAHDVPLSTGMLNLLRELPRFDGPYVFTTTSGKKPINGFSKMKARLDAMTLQGEAIAPWTLHDLRRSAATWMAKTGVAPQVLGALLNHSPGKIQGITAVYNRFRYAEERREALEKWGAHVLGMAQGKNSQIQQIAG